MSYAAPPPPQQPQRPRRTRVLVAVVAAVVVAALVLGGAAGVIGLLSQRDDATPASQAPAPPDPTGSMPAAPADLAAYYDQDLDWQDCAGGECARLRVPLDYAEPDGETIEIAVLRVPARDRANRVGQLVVNPGGPGGSGIDFARGGSLVTGASIARVYDIVGFDPRGVGQSSAVSCGPTRLLDAYLAEDPSPDTAAERAEAERTARTLGETCVRESGDLAEHVSTVEAARDMDVLRGALGEPELDYLGISYGTQLGATYAELFPDRVGRMVLDAAVTPEDDDQVELARQQLEGFQSALEAYLRSCVDSGDCPLGGSVDDAEQGLASLLSDIDADPLPTADDRPLTEGRAYFGIYLPLYAPSLWPSLTEAIRAAQDGDGSGLAQLSDQYVSRGPEGYTANLYPALFSVRCLDRDPDEPVTDLRPYADEFESLSPVFGRSFALSPDICETWPAKPTAAPPEIRAEGAAPIVVIGTTRDPATPYEWAVELADALQSGVLVTRDGDGHAGFNQGNACVDDAIVGYLVDGDVPRDGLRC